MRMGYVILLVVAVAVVAAVVAIVRTRRNDIKKLNYIMDAFEDGELNFRFMESNELNRSLNRMRTIFEKQKQRHEQDSWIKLIRVLTHEIMNTISPIASLSDAMSKSLDEEGDSELDLKSGLETISDSSKNLIKFVQSYRELSGVARSVKKAVDLQQLVWNVIELNSALLSEHDAHCNYTQEEEDLIIYADEGQISHILINLIKNALQAGAKNINISAKMAKEGDISLCIANDGGPIPVANQEQIFVPFFTTKKEGSGIGLSLAKKIMSQHNGNIFLVKSDLNETIFEMVFAG